MQFVKENNDWDWMKNEKHNMQLHIIEGLEDENKSSKDALK